MKISKYFAFFILTAVLSSCVSIPKESVFLSRELNTMIINSRKAHLKLLEYNTELRIREIDEFITKEYTPEFIENYVEESSILDSIEKASDRKSKGMEMLYFSQAAIPRIDERRNEMIKVVRGMETILRKNIDEHYQDMLNVNQTLIAHLSSAVEVVEIRREMEEKLNLSQDLIPINKINSTMEDLIEAGGKSEKIPGLLNEFKNSLK